MLGLTELTSYDAIRAVLGVSTDDLEDATLALDLYAMHLQTELDDVSDDLEASFRSAVAASPKSKAQERLVNAAKLFATYAVANNLTTSLPLFAAKELSDGKAHTTRFSSDPYAPTVEAVREQYAKTRLRLQELMQATSTVTRTFFSSSSPTTDPVTG